MSLKFGRTLLAIPGPSVIPDRVLNAMHRASPNIYEGELVDLAASLYPDLRKVARTEGSVVIYIGNGHAAWEAALEEWDLIAATGADCDRDSFLAGTTTPRILPLDFPEAPDVETPEAALEADLDARRNPRPRGRPPLG